MRDRILAELFNCKGSRIEHTQELHALRDEAIVFLSDLNRERLAKPQGTQLSLTAT